MKDSLRKYKFVVILFLVSIFFVFFAKSSSDVILNLSIDPGDITWGVESSGLNLGTVEVGQYQKELTGQFDGYFWVDDLKGSDLGWSTTVKCDGLNGSNGGILTGIYMMVDDIYPELLLGVQGNVLIDQNFLNYYSINTSVTYIHRPTGENFGRINKYGDKPHIKVVIPPYSTPGSYSGIIYFDM